MSFTRSLAGVLAVAVFSSAQADIINVGPGDAIQDAIDAAKDGDEIIVAPGTYFETINFLGKAIWLHSSDGREMTIIDGTGKVAGHLYSQSRGSPRFLTMKVRHL